MNHDRSKCGTPALALACALMASTGVADGIRPAGDLRAESREAERDCKPLLLEFSSTACSYCRLLEEEVLNPTLLNRGYDRRVLMRKLLIDNSRPLIDFDGSKPVTGAQLASRYRVAVTPTLVFVDSRGRELAERMVGVTTLEFYGGYLDMALAEARDRLRTRPGCKDRDDAPARPVTDAKTVIPPPP